MTLLPYLALLSLPLARGAAQDAAPARENETVLAFDGTEVPRYAFEDWLLWTRGEVAASAFVDYRTYTRAAREAGLAEGLEAEAAALCEAEIAERVEKVYQGDETGWLQELERAYRTPHGRRAQRGQELEAEVALRRMASEGRVVPEEKVLREWRLAYGPEGRRYQVRLLFRRLTMPPMGGLSREEQIAERERLKAELEAEMRALKQRVADGEVFAGLARELSDDLETRARGGAPADGFLDVRGWPPDTLEELARLEPGGVSEPVFRQGGFWLVQLERLVVVPLEDVRAEIEAALAEKGPESDELGELARRLRENVRHEVLPAMWRAPEPGVPLPDEEPVLRVEGEDVSRGEYALWLTRAQGDLVARRFAEDAVIERLAAEAGIDPTPEEIEARVDQDVERTIQTLFAGERERFVAEVERQRGSLEAWRRDARLLARDDLLVQGLYVRSRVIDEDAVRQAWRGRYGPDGLDLRLRMIRIDVELPAVPEDASREEAERLSREAIEAARREATEVFERASEGEDFAQLAQRFSDDVRTGPQGGELPHGFDHRVLPQPLPQAIDALGAGEVSGVLEAGLSFYVFELLERNHVPFEDVAEALRAELEAAPPSLVEIRSHRNVLTRDLAVEVLPAMFETPR